jgi:glutamyl-tRNA synthetase
MTVITRIAPSPTGFMHIGTGYIALYNWLFAKKHNGKFHIRIEDTDRARHSEEAVLAILNGMKWLELDWDGDVISQFEQRNRHVEIANKLLEKGMAYKCYCSQEELQEMRESAKEEGRPSFYDRRWRDKDPKDAPKDINPVIRIKAPIEGESVLQDHVQGEVRVKNETLDDFIILRSDQTPTYMLSVVVDDYDMGITHVIRGDDHLNNAFRQNIIYKAMEWDLPEYAHVPLIHGPDGSKLSKRHGSTSVEEYKDMGYLPEAMRNYLLRLGWSHGDDEIITTEQAIEWFDLDHIGKAPARFDFAKLDHLNTHYIGHSEDQDLIEKITPVLQERYNLLIENDELAQGRLKKGMEELKTRAKNLLQLAQESSLYCKKIPYEFDEKAYNQITENTEILEFLLTAFKNETELTSESVQNICKEIAEKHSEGKLGKVAMPLRAALTGSTVSPSVFNAAAILGLEEVKARLEYSLEKFNSENSTSSAALS